MTHSHKASTQQKYGGGRPCGASRRRSRDAGRHRRDEAIGRTRGRRRSRAAGCRRGDARGRRRSRGGHGAIAATAEAAAKKAEGNTAFGAGNTRKRSAHAGPRFIGRPRPGADRFPHKPRPRRSSLHAPRGGLLRLERREDAERLRRGVCCSPRTSRPYTERSSESREPHAIEDLKGLCSSSRATRPPRASSRRPNRRRPSAKGKSSQDEAGWEKASSSVWGQGGGKMRKGAA